MLKSKIKEIINLADDEACLRLKKITDQYADEWSIRFVEDGDRLRLDENHPIVCKSLNLRLFVGAEIEYPAHTIQRFEIIGMFGDDEFAWVCRCDDGRIVEVDEYDLMKGELESELIFPNIPQYLLFILSFQK